ncbi:MAG TPA: diaminopimelate epimerase [Firmicutes bacterium]|nr:diaminopimelate epimerase [Bacillota bacterium]
MKIPFTKLSTLGNNYLFLDYLDNEVPTLDFSKLAQEMTHPQTGIASDGIIILTPSTVADLKMSIFNNDGSLAKTCGNGLRLVGRYLRELYESKNSTYHVETDANIATVHLAENEITVDLGCAYMLSSGAPLSLTTEPMLMTQTVSSHVCTYIVDAVSLGNPHFIIYSSTSHENMYSELEKLSKKYDVNVGIATILSQTEIKLTTYERGSGFTGACGTNTAACVASAVVRGHVLPHETITVHLPGGHLNVTYTDQGHLLATQSTDMVCTGVYFHE